MKVKIKKVVRTTRVWLLVVPAFAIHILRWFYSINSLLVVFRVTVLKI